MAINTDGQKKIGRLLKKGSKLMTCVSMVDFSFDEVVQNIPLGFDNPDRSIINTRFHDPKDIERSVKQPSAINTQLEDLHKPRHGVIFPADFTQDWYNERQNKNRRKKEQDDEDEEIDFAEMARTQGGRRSRREGQEHEDTSSENQLTTSRNHTSSTEIEPSAMVAQPMQPQDFRNNDPTQTQKFLNTHGMSAAISKAFSPNTSENSNQENNGSTEAFTPLPTQSEQVPVAAEDRAIESWKNQQMIAKQNEQILEDLKSQARSDGYQSGFREGEEKGLISGQKKAAQVFSKVEEIITEFEGLKSLVLDNVQKNFYELSQAIAEALLGREFSIKPEAYATMIQRVIKDTIAPNEFKVKLHPETWQRVNDLGIPELSPHLVKDSAIPVGEFRVESALTVVDVSAKKLVQQLLEKADINLFDDKKAG
jgi:flagellar biosynthesis/type III secretory pathway protein FliH